MLLLELDGDSSELLLEEAQRLSEITEKSGGGEVLAAQEASEQRRLWQIREKVGEAVKARSVYKEVDTVVPRSRLAELVQAVDDASARHDLEAVCYGHAGDGNLHVNLLKGNLSDEAWPEKRDATERAVMKSAVALGGSITGEHGVGYTQRRHLSLRLSPEATRLMKALKNVFDPRGILNPAKIFP